MAVSGLGSDPGLLDKALASGSEPAVGVFAASRHHWDHPRTALGVRVMVEYAAERGCSAEAVLASSGLRPEELDRPGTSVEASQEIAVARNLVALLGDRPGAGLEVGRRFHLTTYGLFGFALLSSPRTVDMARTALSLIGLTFAFSTFTAEITPDGRYATRLCGRGVPGDVRRFLVERDLAASATLQTELFGGDTTAIPLLSARSAFQGGGADPLLGVSIEFGASETALFYDRAYLAEELPQACPQTAQECIAQCERLLSERLDRRGAAAAVRARLRGLGGREDGIEAAARALHVTSRTLRRRLTAEGTSYRRIVDEVRAGLARELLDAGQVSATEAAHHLGFSDLPSFLRAQRRWVETLPGFRRG